MKKWSFWKKTLPLNHAKALNDNDDQKIYQFKLKNYQEVVYVAKIFLEKKEVIIDLNDAEKLERRRIIDFLAGIIYVKKGKIKLQKTHVYYLTIL